MCGESYEELAGYVTLFTTASLSNVPQSELTLSAGSWMLAWWNRPPLLSETTLSLLQTARWDLDGERYNVPVGDSSDLFVGSLDRAVSNHRRSQGAAGDRGAKEALPVRPEYAGHRDSGCPSDLRQRYIDHPAEQPMLDRCAWSDLWP